jgi:hypothetical protein
MLSSSFILLLVSAGLIEASPLQEVGPLNKLRLRASDATATTLSPDAVQSGSFNDGSDEIGSAEVGQAKSLTSTNNFINNCAGKTLTNGLQITTGSCNGISTSIRLNVACHSNLPQLWVISLQSPPWYLQ